MFEKRSVEKMKDDDELEMLLGEIPHATSSLNLHHQHNNLVDHAYGHASFVTQKINSHFNGHGVYDEFFKHSYACASSSVSGFSSSSGLFSCNGHSISEIISPSPPLIDELKSHLIYGDRFGLDFDFDLKNSCVRNLVNDYSLCTSFSKMYINGEQDGVSVYPDGIQSMNGDPRMNFDKYGALDNYKMGFSEYGGVNLSSVPRGTIDFEDPLLEMQNYQRMANLMRSRYSPPPHSPEGMFSRSYLGSSHLNAQFHRANKNLPMGFGVPNVSNLVSDTLLYGSRNGINLANEAYLSPNEANILHYQSPVPYGGNKVPLSVRVPQGSVEAISNEDSLIIQGEGVNYGMNRGKARIRGQSSKNFHHVSGAGKPEDICRSPKMVSPSSKCSSLAEAQGHIYNMAKDQNGCRFLQRMFDEGTIQDVQIIFNEIIDHVVELMMNPFGNYLMQKLLEVCNEEQRMHILFRVVEEPGELVKISLNTHGTRVVQKLIETLKTKHQIVLVISALEPGFLKLIKDLNGNHVVQRCLQCFSNEDSKFIFVAAAKYCVDIATHQHGCCVLQRCISHSTGEHLENLVSEISANGLLLAQDAYGNYVVQYILELEIPSAVSKLTSLFEGNYVHLSAQKFSSHVVEKCLVVGDNETQSRIIHELISATYFDQLLQDPHANYVIQTALRVSEGPLHNSLVEAIESYKAVSRNSPYSKRIFSHKLLRR
ncbi:hypothetical protein ACJIZ3_015685 [Penstemon smallii]|uniref:PUM-HD domain-containing protein n=1 Tax=Penstemon smallii TaxID=265156 RepID=A0ABD3RQH6_9LAMI